MQWTDSIRQMKILLVVTAVIIAVASLMISQVLVSDLKEEEHKRMEIWSEAMRSLNNSDESTDLNLVLSVLNSNTTIPVIVVGSDGEVQTYRNIDIRSKDEAEIARQLKKMVEYLKNRDREIKIYLTENVKSDYITVYYDDSLMLRRLRNYPYVQLGVVLLFVVIAIFALLTSKRAEQNKVWVGLSKETAHQLGTPISSLMAWHEVLKENYPDDELIPEMSKDIERLQLIADRFSKIGSLPELSKNNLNTVMDHVIDYMNHRTSSQVQMIKDFDREDIQANINPQLFEWVIENLCKNAVDAMEGKGEIRLHVFENEDNAIVEVSDTGKGIKKRDVSNVFKPGFTTKKRGWGLGLSLAKRIIEEYHDGKIYVRNTEPGKGTTFRIEIKKA